MLPGQPERPELALPRARRGRAAAPDGVTDLLGGHHGRGPGRGAASCRCPRGRTGPTRTSWRARSRRAAPGCSTRSPTMRTPRVRSGRAERAEQVLRRGAGARRFLVEDDWAHDFGITTTARPVAAQDDSGHVDLPALAHQECLARAADRCRHRPRPARDRILADRGADSMYVSGLLQAAALDVVTQPAWQTHLRSVRDQLRGRRDLLARQPAGARPRGRTSSTCPPAGSTSGPAARRHRRRPARPRVRACGTARRPRHEWFPAEPAGPLPAAQLLAAQPRRLPRRRPDPRRVLGVPPCVSSRPGPRQQWRTWRRGRSAGRSTRRCASP